MYRNSLGAQWEANCAATGLQRKETRKKPLRFIIISSKMWVLIHVLSHQGREMMFCLYTDGADVLFEHVVVCTNIYIHISDTGIN